MRSSQREKEEEHGSNIFADDGYEVVADVVRKSTCERDTDGGVIVGDFVATEGIGGFGER